MRVLLAPAVLPVSLLAQDFCSSRGAGWSDGTVGCTGFVSAMSPTHL